LMSNDEEEEINREPLPDILPILPLRNTVLFPGVIIPITVGRDKSIKLIREAYKASRIIGVVSQKNVSIEDPSVDELNKIGTVAAILKMLQMPDGNTTVIIQGKKRFEMGEIVQDEPYLKARVTPFGEIKPKLDKEFSALVNSVKDLAMQIIETSPNIPTEAGIAIKNIENPSFLVNFISSNMNADVA